MACFDRRRDPHKLVDEYQHLVERYGVKQIGLVDPIFPLVLKDLAPFCDELVRRGLDQKCSWLSETRADRLDEAQAGREVEQFVAPESGNH